MTAVSAADEPNAFWQVLAPSPSATAPSSAADATMGSVFLDFVSVEKTALDERV